MAQTYPNLTAIARNVIELMADTFPETKQAYTVNLSFHSFEQIWPDTAGGLSVPGNIAGSAITQQYTTVVEAVFSYASEDKAQDPYQNLFAVYFGNTCGYLIQNPTDIFFDDMQKELMRGCGEQPDQVYNATAVKRYGMLKQVKR